ncbi:DUF86 domain-containing protein [Corynebacterium amycolatum]|uniref:HepT-like ribonuclease domain-containing protein n=1 Tax=Corynebacterium TaxID=1716 RepID=UPI0009F4513E|nr:MULTISPECIES: HepT-like ribonuclease domain-containing protein [Corynebacterium]MCQ9170917.1 DUF86 domain-containing protein [Corynebacterium amycolatum]
MASTCFLPSCSGTRSPLRRSPRRCRCESQSGEAVNHLPDEITGAHPEIAWPQIRDFRNILVHQYFGVDIDVVRDVVDTHLPPLA